ncbi:MAG: TonB-dependent receptor [Candidatus Methylacidiphilales bacterium]|nr:TonB-dependent receptor [Candidatus Methylacidiphilales bacterium]
MKPESLNTHQKALRINIDALRYGTFAEIGAAQEVARWFFRVGGAASTVAKSMSAYDMTFSDAIYGPTPRYVSRQRLMTMLDHEYGLLLERLQEKRGDQTCFFVYANTVAARSYRGNHECHGWMGIRFQRRPGAAPSDIILHVRLLDKENLSQQEALGIIGVNLIFGSVYYNENPDLVIDTLLDDLNRDRIEVDMLEFRGEDFAHLDNRLINLQLVRKNLTPAVVFSPDRLVHQASEVLYRHPVLLERGNFRPVTQVNLDMIAAAHRQFMVEPQNAGDPPIEIMEITVNNLLNAGDVDPEDFLARVDILSTLGKTVMISNFAEFHRLAAFLRRNSPKMLGIVLGISLLQEIFNEKYYTSLEGGILEGFGRLFKNDLRLYVYPALSEERKLLKSANITVPAHLKHLHEHLLENRFIVDVDSECPATVTHSSRDVAARIAADDHTWEKLVSEPVARMVKENRYFGYRPSS